MILARGSQTARLKLELAHVASFGAFLTLLKGKYHTITFIEAAIPVGGNRGVMDEYIRLAVIDLNEPKTLGVVEPLDNTFQLIVGHSCLSLSAPKLALLQYDPNTVTESDISRKQTVALGFSPSQTLNMLACGADWLKQIRDDFYHHAVIRPVVQKFGFFGATHHAAEGVLAANIAPAK